MHDVRVDIAVYFSSWSLVWTTIVLASLKAPQAINPLQNYNRTMKQCGGVSLLTKALPCHVIAKGRVEIMKKFSLFLHTGNRLYIQHTGVILVHITDHEFTVQHNQYISVIISCFLSNDYQLYSKLSFIKRCHLLQRPMAAFKWLLAFIEFHILRF